MFSAIINMRVFKGKRITVIFLYGILIGNIISDHNLLNFLEKPLLLASAISGDQFIDMYYPLLYWLGNCQLSYYVHYIYKNEYI